MNPQQLREVFALSAEKRFDHFVKVVADREQAWGLYQDGWAMAAANDGTLVFPLWPHKDYAEACALGDWAGYQPKMISLNDLVKVVLPQLKKDGSLPGILPTPAGKGATPSIGQLMAALDEALQRY